MAAFRALLLPAALVAGCSTVPSLDLRLNGTEWQIRSINGEPTPGGIGYRMEFNPTGVFSAGLGCNGHMGEFRIVDGQVIVGRSENGEIDSIFFPGRLVGTERDCPGTPGERFEPAALKILKLPMTAQWEGGRRLRLSNRVGSILLAR